MNMCTFIAGRIIKAGETSVESAQNKYRAYFVKTKIYERYQAEVDAILTQDGYEEYIVEE